MAFTLSDGTYINNTGTTDARGYPIYIGDNGNLYTIQNTKIVLSRKGSSLAPDEQYQTIRTLAATGNSDLIPVYSKLKEQFRETLPDSPDLYDLPEFSQFEDQAKKEVDSFYIKDFEQLSKEFKVLRKQAEEKTKLDASQKLESYSAFRGVEDRDFASKLQSAQDGFAGRSTTTSGFKDKALTEQDALREDILAEKKRALDQGTATRDLGFAHLLENADIEEEGRRLALERRQEQDRLDRARQLQEEEIMRRRSASGASDENADYLLNSGLTS